MGDITQILQRLSVGDTEAPNRLYDIVYHELRQIAAAKMAGEFVGRTLQPTALVHEVWLRLGGDQQASWQNRAHFFGAAAEAMRRILIDRARRRCTARRGGGLEHVDIDSVDVTEPDCDDERLLALQDALDKFTAQDPRKAELVKLRFFIGLTIEEAAAALGISEPTAQRWWAFARAWLTREVQGSGCVTAEP